MITEDLLERGLAEAASEYDVPAGAVDRIRDQLAPSVADEHPEPRRWLPRRPTPHGLMVLGAASLVLLIVIAFAVGGNGSRGTQESGGAAAVSSPSAARPSNTGTAAGLAGSKRAAHLPAAVPAPAPVQAQDFATAGTGAATSAGSAPTTGGSAGVAAGPVTPIPSVPDRIVKTGELDLQVPKGEVTATLNQLTALASQVRGYVADSRTSEGGIAPSGEITLRVPVNMFEDTISRARAITGVKVLSLQTSAKDVTSKYVDLKARLKALQDTRNTFLTLLSRAQTIGETLAVQQHVTDVQTQIEQIQGQIKVLANQSALSTLTVTVDQKVTPVATKVHHQKSGLRKAIDRSVSRFVHGIEAIVGIIGPLLLAVLLIAFFWVAGKFGYRVLRRRMV